MNACGLRTNWITDPYPDDDTNRRADRFPTQGIFLGLFCFFVFLLSVPRPATADHPPTVNIGELILTGDNPRYNHYYYKMWICEGKRLQVDLTGQDLNYKLKTRPTTSEPKHVVAQPKTFPGDTLILKGVSKGKSRVKFDVVDRTIASGLNPGQESLKKMIITVLVVGCEDHDESVRDGREITKNPLPAYPGIQPGKFYSQGLQRRKKKEDRYLFTAFVCAEKEETVIQFEKEPWIQNLRNKTPSVIRVWIQNNPTKIHIQPNPNKVGQTGVFLVEAKRGRGQKIITGINPSFPSELRETKIVVRLVEKCNLDSTIQTDEPSVETGSD